MNTTRPAWATNVTTTEPVTRGLAATCHCGQDLDVCAGNHCPRCGTTLFHPPALVLAA
jgi:hypothetical protein